MTKSETDNLKEELHAPAKRFEMRASCLQVDIAALGRPELVHIVEQLPQRKKGRGVMSLSARGDVTFVSSCGEAHFFRLSDIGDLWSFLHRRLLLIIALQNDRGSYDLHFFSMHRRRGVDLIFKLRKMVSEERIEMMRTERTQPKTEERTKKSDGVHQEIETGPAPPEEVPTRTPSPEDLLASSPSFPPSASQSSAGSWIDVLTAMRLDPHNRSGRSKRNPFLGIGCSSEYQILSIRNEIFPKITNPFVLSAVQSCFRTRATPSGPARAR